MTTDPEDVLHDSVDRDYLRRTLLRTHEWMTTADLAAQCGLTPYRAMHLLEQLRQTGHVERKQQKNTTSWRAL